MMTVQEIILKTTQVQERSTFTTLLKNWESEIKKLPGFVIF